MHHSSGEVRQGHHFNADTQTGSQTSAFFFFFAPELFGLRRGKWVSPQHPREAEDGCVCEFGLNGGGVPHELEGVSQSEF